MQTNSCKTSKLKKFPRPAERRNAAACHALRKTMGNCASCRGNSSILTGMLPQNLSGNSSACSRPVSNQPQPSKLRDSIRFWKRSLSKNNKHRARSLDRAKQDLESSPVSFVYSTLPRSKPGNLLPEIQTGTGSMEAEVDILVPVPPPRRFRSRSMSVTKSFSTKINGNHGNYAFQEPVPTVTDPSKTFLTVPFQSIRVSNSSESSVYSSSPGETYSSSSADQERDLERRFATFRRPLRGPYGEMLEAEMSKSDSGKICSRSRTRQNSLPTGNEFPRVGNAWGSRYEALAKVKPPPRRKISANIPLILNQSDLEPEQEMDLDSNAKAKRLLSNRRITSVPGDLNDSQNVHTPRKLTNLSGFPELQLDSGTRLQVSRKQVHRTQSESAGTFWKSSKKLQKFESSRKAMARPTTLRRRLSSVSQGLAFLDRQDSPSRDSRSKSLDIICAKRRGSEQLSFWDIIGFTSNGSSSPCTLNVDTRTHVICELYETERSYVESLQVLVNKYLQPLKSPECSFTTEPSLVDEIFYQVPEILAFHEAFLEQMKIRLGTWNSQLCIGDLFMKYITKSSVVETYVKFVNNFQTAKEALHIARTKPQFNKFLNAMAREHRGKLTLDALLIMPVQRIPRYELLIKVLLKHTSVDHSDFPFLSEAQREVHQLALKINCVENQLTTGEVSDCSRITLRQLENLMEGFSRSDFLGQGQGGQSTTFLRQDSITMTASGRTCDRVVFLMSDFLLVAVEVKKRSTSFRKSSISSTAEDYKYQLLRKIPLQDIDFSRSKDEGSGPPFKDIDLAEEDAATLKRIAGLAADLHTPHLQLNEAIDELEKRVVRHLGRMNETQQSHLVELTITNQDHSVEDLSFMFSSSDSRTSWEEAFIEAKLKLQSLSREAIPLPEFVTPFPLRKTRPGLQLTCACTFRDLQNDKMQIWICSSDDYVGQVCVVTSENEPAVVSLAEVCDSRINCIAEVPSNIPCTSVEENDFQNQSMWLGTEDGKILIFKSSEDLTNSKGRKCIQHNAAVLCIVYASQRVFISLANGQVIGYDQNPSGNFNVSIRPSSVSIGSSFNPVTQILPVESKLWCPTQNVIKILDSSSLTVEDEILIGPDSQRAVLWMERAGLSVWIAYQNSSTISLLDSVTRQMLYEVNVGPSVAQTLSGCDDIIRQHKMACLRVTSLAVNDESLLVGTSAGVIVTQPVTQSLESGQFDATTLKCLRYGHTGQVRFLVCGKKSKQESPGSSDDKTLAISGGAGYETFPESYPENSVGKDDSVNHILLWHV